MKVKTIVESVVFLALVFAATIIIQVYQPATGGYFNLGESVIYIAAMISTPLVAGIAGGVGASLADVVTGYGIFAPATLVIKFIEGYVAGILFRRFREIKGSGAFLLRLSVGIIYFSVLTIVGVRFLSGKVYFGPEGLSLEANIPYWFWMVVAILSIIAVMPLAWLKRQKGAEPVALLLAALIMVVGYFLYEFFVSNPLTDRPPIAALAEVPLNISQGVIGATVALWVSRFLRSAGYVK